MSIMSAISRNAKDWDQVIYLLCQEVAQGVSVKTACETVGKSYTSFQKVCITNPEFEKKIRQAEAGWKGKLEKMVVRTAIEDADATLGMKILGVRSPNEWGQKIDLAKLSDSDLTRLFEYHVAQVEGNTEDEDNVFDTEFVEES